MDTAQLLKLAQENRARKQAGIALLISSCFLGVFLFVPLGPAPTKGAPAAVAEAQSPHAVFPSVSIEAEAAIVLDLSTGQTLFEKNADAQLPLASLTKLLTVYAGLTQLSLDTPVPISQEDTQVEFPRAFNVGQSFAFGDLARLTLTASLNDGAAAILEESARRAQMQGSDFLTSVASQLNLSQTFAVNGNGLDVSTVVSGGYGSARDIAHLAGALVTKASDITLATTHPYAEAVSLGRTAYKVKNTDPVVATIPGLLLSKTGYTDLAKGNLALVFDSGINHPIAIIVLGSSQTARFTDGTALVNATLAYFSNASTP